MVFRSAIIPSLMRNELSCVTAAPASDMVLRANPYIIPRVQNKEASVARRITQKIVFDERFLGSNASKHSRQEYTIHSLGDGSK